jgi:hypothetical protein
MFVAVRGALSYAGTTLLRTEKLAAALRFSFLILPTNSGRNNDPGKLFLVQVPGDNVCRRASHETITQI